MNPPHDLPSPTCRPSDIAEPDFPSSLSIGRAGWVEQHPEGTRLGRFALGCAVMLHTNKGIRIGFPLPTPKDVHTAQMEALLASNESFRTGSSSGPLTIDLNYFGDFLFKKSSTILGCPGFLTLTSRIRKRCIT
ncbi:Hypothetical predicted protein [Podarcis lilfordi]|uniref:Uncharacterized protein n=1 Tax=Podarcis lilfordi TaxID=74358 RepID=A0AA35LKI5_9SAUR|nr:Hypothetical predicted protein [Podarcis lilfordi]